jgi:hypothetical protein
MLRFVILTHDHPHLHWDLLLEVPGQEALSTWRLEKPPAPGEIIKAQALPDHRRVYLDYEGPISEGRGEVERWDAGEYELLSQSAAEKKLRLRGIRLQGGATLNRDDSGGWTFTQT